jgi:D-alanyl-D-alanine carboxypeptidase/D-alanyl-D-alanine-endopeptidase (penicillin-binding protein 4)
VDYYTLENSMIPTPAGQVAHPGLDRRPGSLLVRAWGTAPPTASIPAWPSTTRQSTPRPASSRRSWPAASPVTGNPVSLHKSSVDRQTSTTSAQRCIRRSPSQQDHIAAPLQDRRVLATHVSIPMIQDLTLTNKISQNLHAELMLRLLGKVFGTDGSFAQGTRVVRQFMLDSGVNDADFFPTTAPA